MRNAFYKTATDIAEAKIKECIRLHHFDQAYGAYQLWMEFARALINRVPDDDSQRLFALSQPSTALAHLISGTAEPLKQRKKGAS